MSAIFGRRIPNQGSAVPTDTLGCPRTVWCSQQGGRTSHCAAWGGCGQCWSRQAAVQRLVPRKLHLCWLLSDQHPTGATSPAHPCQQRQLCTTALAAEVRPETSTWYLPASSFPLKHWGLAVPGTCSAAVHLSLHPIGPHISAPSLASDPRPTGKGATLLDETELPPQVQLLPPKADKC